MKVEICKSCGEEICMGNGRQELCEDCRDDFDQMDLEDRLELAMRMKGND